MINESMNIFFKNLSAFGNENSLSDIIAAAYNTSSEFRKLFLDFFFPGDKNIKEQSLDMEREISSGDSRFDLVINTKNYDNYIIENKIYDQNDHYEKYKRKYSENRIGFIANYDVKAIKYKNKHTWNEFCGYIKKILEAASKEESLISCILNYIKGVCRIMEERQFKVMELKDLGYAVKVVQNILDRMGFKINNRAKGSSENQIGFWVEKDNRGYWFGFYFTEEDYGFWGEIYNGKIKTKSFDDLKYGEYDKYSTEDSKWFKLRKSKFDLLNSEKTSFEQKEKVLKEFILEIESIN
nr:hypothetical protein [uncultured Treponema sp.]